MNILTLYTTDDGESQIQPRADLGTVCLTQLDMAALFDATKQNISLHLKNLLEDGKKYQAQRYNLYAILAVGYRVRSLRGVQFRRWASNDK
jgi:hypothetical protein